MNKNKKNQAPVVETQEDVVDEAVETEKTPQLTEEQRKMRVHNFLLKLQEAKETKEIGDQKKIRRSLRKLGFYLSKEKAKMMEALLDSNS